MQIALTCKDPGTCTIETISFEELLSVSFRAVFDPSRQMKGVISHVCQNHLREKYVHKRREEDEGSYGPAQAL